MNKAAQGRRDEINTCIACNQACLDHTFANRMSTCLVNPRACHETELTIVRAPARRRYAVVGAGPAGLAAATTLAERGHEVHLYDAAESIGGQFNLARRIPGKEEFDETLRYFARRIEVTGVQLHLNTRISAEALVAAKFGEVLLATGVTPRDPKIPGQDHPAGAELPRRADAAPAGGPEGGDRRRRRHRLRPRRIPGHRHRPRPWHRPRWTCVPGCANGAWPTPRGQRGGVVRAQPEPPAREVLLLQRKAGKHGAGLGKTTGWIHRAALKMKNVEMLAGVNYERIGRHHRPGHRRRPRGPVRHLRRKPQGRHRAGAGPASCCAPARSRCASCRPH